MLDHQPAPPSAHDTDAGPFVQTVTGRIPARTLGFTLPHEHTGLELWHIQNRWDYWELIRDENVIAPELERFRDLGGTCLVDVTNHGLGRDAARLCRLSERTGLPIVMGAGWYREAYYPPEALIDRRPVDDLADEIVREFHEGSAAPASGPGSSARSAPTSRGCPPRRSASSEPSRAPRRTPAWPSPPTPPSRPWDWSSSASSSRRGSIRPGSSSATPISHPYLEYHLALLERGASIEFDFLGMDFSRVDAAMEPRGAQILRELLDRGHVDHLLLSQDVCHTLQLRAFGGNGYTYLQETYLPRLRAAGVPDDAITRMTVENPRRVLSVA